MDANGTAQMWVPLAWQQPYSRAFAVDLNIHRDSF
jgi:hypothetical protein